MNRAEKEQKVSELNEALSRAKFVVVTDYKGLKVTEMEKLRRELRQVDSELRIAKNTLLRLAARGTESEALIEQISGTTAVTMGYADPVGVAKAVTGFAEEYPALELRAAVLEGSVLDSAEVLALSKLPDKDTLRAKLLGTLSGVPTGFVRVLNAVPRDFVLLLKAYMDKKEQ